ncbi:MAG: serine protease, partial [Vicinamibacterales bacterium]
LCTSTWFRLVLLRLIGKHDQDPNSTWNGGLDVVRLDGLADSCRICRRPMVCRRSTRGRVHYIIGYPKGGRLQIWLHDSTLLDVDDTERLVHYRTPTEPGSSGSPVFNSEWEVIALHHSGSSQTRRLHGNGTYEANEKGYRSKRFASVSRAGKSRQ